MVVGIGELGRVKMVNYVKGKKLRKGLQRVGLVKGVNLLKYL